MKRMRTAAALLVAAMVASLATAQSHRRGLIVADSQAGLYRVSPTGVIATIGSYATTAMPNIWSMVMDNDNEHVIAVATGVPAAVPSGALLRIDPASGSATTFANVPAPYPLTVDDSGNFLVGVRLPSEKRILLRIDETGTQFTTVLNAINFPVVARDSVSGQWIVHRVVGLFERVSADFRTLIFGDRQPFGWFLEMASDPIGPSLHVATTSALVRIDLNTTALTTVAGPIPQGTPAWLDGAIAVDRAADASGGLIYVSRSTPAPSIDVYDRAGTVVRTIGPFPSTVSAIVFDAERNITFGMIAAPNHRAIRIRIPEDAGKLCVCALSVTGYTPGRPIAGGRTIPLRFDDATRLGVAGQLAPWFTGNVGSLDANGRMVATLDLNPLGATIASVPVWVAAITMDPAAPGGIATVTRAQIVVH